MNYYYLSKNQDMMTIGIIVTMANEVRNRNLYFKSLITTLPIYAIVMGVEILTSGKSIVNNFTIIIWWLQQACSVQICIWSFNMVWTRHRSTLSHACIK